MKWSLNGNWECEFSNGQKIDVEVPGCWDTYVNEKDIADKVIYRKSFVIEEMRDTAYRLRFGAVSYYCDVFLNGEKVGSHEGMWDTFFIDAGKALKQGENKLALEIWKPGYHKNDRFFLREVLSGFIPDISCTFGGIWDDASLESSPSFFLDYHSGAGDMEGRAAIQGRVAGVEREILIKGRISDPAGNKIQIIEASINGDGEFVLPFNVENPILWDTENPARYQYQLELDDGITKEVVSGKLSFRTVAAKREQILLNKKPVYARGLLHWGYYDEITPNPGMDVIKDEIVKTKSLGFNMIKHCLYIPRSKYFDLADEMGMLLWVELPLWLPDATEELKPRIYREFPALINQIVGHGSVVMLSLGCELDSCVESKVLEEMYTIAKQRLDILVRDNSGSGECYEGLNVDYADFSDYHFYADLQNMENLQEIFTPGWRAYRPCVFGEFCDSDTLRDLDIVRKRKGVEYLTWELQDEVKNPICILKPDFFLGKHDSEMIKSGIREEFELLSMLSSNHSMVHRKTTVEQTRAFQAIGGYNITSIRDVPIATSGLFDDFMEEKFPKEKFCLFNQATILLQAWDLTRISINGDHVMGRERYGFFGGEVYSLHLLVSNYGGMQIRNPKITYKVTCGTATLNSETIKGESIENGMVSRTAYLTFELPQVTTPQTLILKVCLQDENQEVQNEWPIFLYPRPEKQSVKIGVFDPLHVFERIERLYDQAECFDGRNSLNAYQVILCSMLTPEISEYIKRGGRAVYVQRGEGHLESVPVAFWREGLIRRYDHPLLDGLNYDNWMDDLRFFGSTASTAFSDSQLGEFTYRKSIIRRYDCREWRADDYLMELGCGDGKLFATTLRLDGGEGKQPLFIENNRFGQWILNRMIEYLLCS